MAAKAAAALMPVMMMPLAASRPPSCFANGVRFYALLQFDTMTPFLIIAASCTGLQFLIGNVIEPAVMGRTHNLCSFVIILSLTFWSTLWGIARALLSVPIAVIAMIVCSHVPQRRPVAIMLSKDCNVATGHPLQ